MVKYVLLQCLRPVGMCVPYCSHDGVSSHFMVDWERRKRELRRKIHVISSSTKLELIATPSPCIMSLCNRSACRIQWDMLKNEDTYMYMCARTDTLCSPRQGEAD